MDIMVALLGEFSNVSFLIQENESKRKFGGLKNTQKGLEKQQSIMCLFHSFSLLFSYNYNFYFSKILGEGLKVN